jgi:CsoR family transcriptional regulator, copper-sensing transcriptional repressor
MKDPAEKKKLLARLRRLEGQLSAVRRMVEEDRHCPEVLVQIAAIRGGTGRVGQLLLEEHVRTCVADALQAGDAEQRNATLSELTGLMGRFGGAK